MTTKINKKTGTFLIALSALSLVFVPYLQRADASSPMPRRLTASSKIKPMTNNNPTNKTNEKKSKTSSNAKKSKNIASAVTKSVLVGPITERNSQSSGSIHGRKLYLNKLPYTSVPGAIANQPTASWVGGWNTNIAGDVNAIVTAASAQDALATIVAYNIPQRDCGGYSAGGSDNANQYKLWIREFARGIGDRQAIVILEPDALAQIDCLSVQDQKLRYELLTYAVDTLALSTRSYAYIDAGHSRWVSPSVMAQRLGKAHIANAQGFSLNVSNFQTTTDSTSYGNRIAGIVKKSFVIDTSRNGNGSNDEWCNPSGRALGSNPTTDLSGYVDAYLWVKTPGESDGPCNGGPSAGAWWSQYANGLVSNRS